MKVLQQLAQVKAAPDANLDEIGAVEQSILASIRKPYDTASPGSPQGAAMAMGDGATAPAGTAPGELSPMLQALMGQGGPGGPPAELAPSPGGGMPMMSGGLVPSAPPPNMDEVARMIAGPGGRQ